MQLRRLDAGAIRGSDDNRTGKSSPRTGADPGGMGEYLVNRGVDKAHELYLDNRPQPIERHAYRCACDA
jgi:hypothetical protein